ncbi:sce7726 family protein [Pseudomonas sp. NPDC047961]
MLNEQDIKVAVINRLRNRVAVGDSVIVNEMVFGGRDRRADLVMANGHLQAFEIKSDVDSLSRLEGQVENYLSNFDKLTLVVSSKYVERALATDERVGVWEAKCRNGYAVLSVKRAGRIQPVADKQTLCSFLHKSDLERLIRSAGVKKVSREAAREVLYNETSKLPLSVIRQTVIDTVKGRYRVLSDSFLASCEGQVSTSDLDKLSKSKTKRRELEERFSQRDAKSSPPIRQLNLSRFFPDGNIPDSIPRYVRIPG